ncbi:polysaccharide biosynthesis/export family protein [Labilibaculum sp. DW002]|uniref:Polysaccharide biosynthesis/export family protein n=1 Tax=Paralabilibaculum antarcticum TaxID=2912572 RepID=A0ABT5VQ52_9BACT|nr:polysaccharide biosynthesis/export family protein [Labilibaculum sp. DW002]MDE5417548.1 polysaccharide biosynthesis/export family protein [Labilibaculum sp. DW002]
MKRLLFILLATGLFFSSCRTNKDLVYLSNTTDDELLEGIPAKTAEYIIKTNDNLYVDIQSMSPEVNAMFNPTQAAGATGGTSQNYGQPSSQYLNGFHVDLVGNIKLPVIGDVAVAGMTLNNARNAIQLRADEYLKDATVKVKLLSFKITVLGEVKSPGVYYNYNNNMTVLDGISMASGVTDYGRIQKVLVLRPTDKGSKTFRLDLSNKKFLSSDAFFLQPNDVVYVEPDKYKNVKLNSPLYSLFLSTLSTLILVLNIL